MLWGSVLKVPVEKLTSRERKALKAFERREVLYVYRLPSAIGRTTMEQLVEKGWTEIVDPGVGRYSNSYGWRLIR